VVMPQLDGEKLSQRVLALHPRTRVLFTSAYSEDDLADQGLTSPVPGLLQKPYSPRALAFKVREVLDQRA
jgi:two-component system cell cycle sensor histidine kinase/response regulator CckA